MASKQFMPPAAGAFQHLLTQLHKHSRMHVEHGCSYELAAAVSLPRRAHHGP